MVYNPEIHHRRSIRLKEFDYSKEGYYFLTICTQNREHVFGEIRNGEMVLNDAGRMVEKWYYELENKFSDIKCHDHIIMPNHIHFVIQNVGANLCVRPSLDPDVRPCMEEGENNPRGEHNIRDEHNPRGEHIGSPLRKIIQWFKTMITNEYMRNVKNCGWSPFAGKLFQSNYYEHVIRDDRDLFNIRQYIRNNSQNWEEDENYQAAIRPGFENFSEV